jgi:hypothetical protein
MAEQRSIGLKSIRLGAIASDGGMGTSLTALGVTFRGTATLETAEGTVNDFFSEENSDPEEIIEEKGTTTLKWSIINLDPAALARCLGGSVTGDAGEEKWNAPDDVPEIEQSVEIVTSFGVKVEIPRAKIRARLVWNLSRTDIAQVSITATVLRPEKASAAALTISKV